MTGKIPHSVVWFLLVLALEYGLCQEPLPILELYELNPAEVTIKSGCTDGLVSDVDLFTVKGKVNRNGSDTKTFDHNNLFLQAVQNVSTDAWESQCQVNLAVCRANRNADCYCEREDKETGDFYLVMKIKVKSMYADGGLRLIWNDKRTSTNPPITSNVVGYYHGYIRDSCLPFLELYEVDPAETIKYSYCLDGLVNDIDFFTVKGRVNKNGSNPKAYVDTNLYLQAVKDVNTNAWASQCRPDLTVCRENLTTGCYCERKDNATGDYHLVMRIQVKTIYAGGRLMLSWNDKRSPQNSPILSTPVGYYNGTIRDSCPDIMKLFKPDPTETIQISSCVDALLSDVDQFTVRGKVTKNGTIPNVFDDTGLYLQASQNVSTDFWESQCQLNLSVCAANLTDDCYCESLDEDGYYHLVMKVMAKSIYSDGGLRFSWNDSRSPSHPPIASNVVDYYNDTIRERAVVTAEIQGDNGETLYQSSTFDDVMDFYVNYTTKMRNVSFCVLEPATNRSIQIEDGDQAANSTDPCIVLDLQMGTQGRNLTMTFTEMEGCERKGTYRLILMRVPQGPSGLTDREKMYIAIGVVLGILFLVLVAGGIFGYYLRKHNKKDHSPDETAKLENPEPEVIRTRL